MTRYFFSVTGDYLGGFYGDDALALVPEDAIEISEPPSHGLDKLMSGIIVPYVEPNDLSTQLLAAFNTLNDDAQASFYQAKIQVQDALNLGKVAVAKKIIENTSVPSELQSLKDALLAEFDL